MTATCWEDQHDRPGWREIGPSVVKVSVRPALTRLAWLQAIERFATCVTAQLLRLGEQSVLGVPRSDHEKCAGCTKHIGGRTTVSRLLTAAMLHASCILPPGSILRYCGKGLKGKAGNLGTKVATGRPMYLLKPTGDQAAYSLGRGLIADAVCSSCPSQL